MCVGVPVSRHLKCMRLINNMHLINDHNTCSFAAMDSLHWDSVIRGHRAYKEIWTPFVGEVLHVEQETHNVQDRFAVAVVKDLKEDITVGHVPRGPISFRKHLLVDLINLSNIPPNQGAFSRLNTHSTPTLDR